MGGGATNRGLIVVQGGGEKKALKAPPAMKVKAKK